MITLKVDTKSDPTATKIRKEQEVCQGLSQKNYMHSKGKVNGLSFQTTESCVKSSSYRKMRPSFNIPTFKRLKSVDILLQYFTVF